jgi:hypothetical protein
MATKLWHQPTLDAPSDKSAVRDPGADAPPVHIGSARKPRGYGSPRPNAEPSPST